MMTTVLSKYFHFGSKGVLTLSVFVLLNAQTCLCNVIARTYFLLFPHMSCSCWLVWRPSLGSFFVPAGLVVLVTWIYFLCTICRLRKQKVTECTGMTMASRGTEGQPALPGSPNLLSTDCVVERLNPSISPEDQYSLKIQYLVLVATHFLFLIVWCCGAVAIWLTGYISFLFSCLYGIAAIVLGIFLVLHHCFRRRDIQTSWFAYCRGHLPSYHLSTYTHTCTTGRGMQSFELGSQLFINCHPPGDSHNSSDEASSVPSGISSVGSGPCKLTNLLQVIQDTSNGTSHSPAGNNTTTSTENITKLSNNILPTANLTTLGHSQRKKVGSRTKQGRNQSHHRGEGRGHYHFKTLSTATGGGSLKALGSIELEHSTAFQTIYKLATSETGSIQQSLSENQAGTFTDGKCSGKSVASPSEGSDGGSRGSGSCKPFPLLPSMVHRAGKHGHQRQCASRDNLKFLSVAEWETKHCSYPLNSVNSTVPGVAAQNCSMLQLEQDMSSTDQYENSVGRKSGLWKSETVV